MKSRKLLIVGTFMTILLCTLALTGCSDDSGPSRRAGWVGTSRANQMAYSYTTFTGTEKAKVRVEAGRTIVLAYAARVNKGALTLRVQSPSKTTIWQTELSQDIEEQEVEITPTESGPCNILVTGEETGGSFALSWSVR